MSAAVDAVVTAIGAATCATAPLRSLTQRPTFIIIIINIIISMIMNGINYIISIIHTTASGSGHACRRPPCGSRQTLGT